MTVKRVPDTFPVRVTGSMQKETVGDRRREKQSAAAKADRALSALYAYVYRRDGYKCIACKKPVVVGSPDELKRAHPHHIVPRSLADKAVKHTKENVCTLCPLCHGDIGKKLFISGNAETRLSIRRSA